MNEHTDNVYLTTQEVADLLRVKQRKVYDLVSREQIPCSRVTGKLLFPRDEILAMIEQQSRSGATEVYSADVEHNQLPPIILGSHDPLLEAALKACGSSMPTLIEHSLAGLDRFEKGEGVATGLHVYEPEAGKWNVSGVTERFASRPVVLLTWAMRSRGLLVNPDMAERIKGMTDLAGRRLAVRQKGSGSYSLLEHLLMSHCGLLINDIEQQSEAFSETDAAIQVLEGKADVTLGLSAFASRFGLEFVPVIEERFDLLIDRRAFFEAQFQTLVKYTQTPAFQLLLAEFPGYRTDSIWQVQFNGAG